jgi:Uri superfamily endonuclease
LVPVKKGSYVLVFKLDKPTTLDVGRLGAVNLSSGNYVYCGSARGPGGLAARIKHHAKISARPFWHIDYIKNVSQLLSVGFDLGNERMECRWAEILLNQNLFQIVRPGFGSSDCPCSTHFYFSDLSAREIFLILQINHIVDLRP